MPQDRNLKEIHKKKLRKINENLSSHLVNILKTPAKEEKYHSNLIGSIHSKKSQDINSIFRSSIHSGNYRGESFMVKKIKSSLKEMNESN